MFGIIRPCSAHACATLREAWRAHLCGLCLTLRDGQGQSARLATNYDTLIVSALAEAQLPSSSPRRTAGPCALRGFRSAEVVDSGGSGARLAAAVSLMLAAGRLRDHVADGDGAAGTTVSTAGMASTLVGMVGGVAGGAAAARRRLATRWEAAGAGLGASVGFDTTTLASTVDRQLALERRAVTEWGDPGTRTGAPGTGPARSGAGEGGPVTLLELTAPAEEAVAQAFAHTAVLAGLPGNVEPLAEAGRFFGRIAHLLDAVEDQAEDAERGAFNPLTVTGTSREEARRLCDDAAHGLALAVRELRLAERHLVEVLLVTEVRRAVERTFGAVACRPPAGAAPASGTGVATGSYRRPGWIRRSAAGAGTVLTCGLWRPRWSRKRGGSCASRCYVCNQDCWESCDCCANCSCCACSCCE